MFKNLQAKSFPMNYILFKPTKRKVCTCGKEKTKVYSRGEYFNFNFLEIDYCCIDCFGSVLIPKLQSIHKDQPFQLKMCMGYGRLPVWLKLV